MPGSWPPPPRLALQWCQAPVGGGGRASRHLAARKRENHPPVCRRDRSRCIYMTSAHGIKKICFQGPATACPHRPRQPATCSPDGWHDGWHDGCLAPACMCFPARSRASCCGMQAISGCEQGDPRRSHVGWAAVAGLTGRYPRDVMADPGWRGVDLQQRGRRRWRMAQLLPSAPSLDVRRGQRAQRLAPRGAQPRPLPPPLTRPPTSAARRRPACP